MDGIQSLAELGADRWSPDDAFVVFDRQDSGCRSYGIVHGGQRWFVKVAESSRAQSSLASAVRFHRAVSHPAIVRPVAAGFGGGATLVYPWVDGRVLNHATIDGTDRSGLDRFRSLPEVDARAAISAILEAHVAVADARFISVDFYDGAMLYDFEGTRMHLIDLDEYRPGPFSVEGERLPGSTSYMAPEESQTGARIDEQTMVFTLGRSIQHLLGDVDGAWRGQACEHQVVTRATRDDRAERHPSVRALIADWGAASSAA